MDINKKLLTLLVIFGVIASAGIVCAAEDGGYAGYRYADSLEPGAGLPIENQTANTTMHVNTTDNVTGNATGNATGNITNNTTNNTTNTTGNATVPHTLLSTGNPIFILLAVLAVVGGATIIRRK